MFCDMETLVSIITACYNSSFSISKTIESVLSQTYSNWEMLIVDDCSTDNSLLIIQSYCKKDSRIRYLKTDKPSGSPALPRNIGIEHAIGEYIAFLDSDDIWLPNKLQEQYDFLEQNNYSFIYSNYEKISWDGKRAGRIIKLRNSSSYWDILESCSIPCLTVLLKRELVGHIRFKPMPKEDYGFWLEILRKGCIAYNTDKVHALYRESSNSRSSNKLAMFKNQWKILRNIEKVKKIPALYFMTLYTFRGFVKYLR